MFISFEGPEGCGKSTQAKLLAEFLGPDTVLTLEPGGTPLGQKLRAILLEPGNRLEPESELALFAADRADHVGKVIKPALKAGKIVVCDRYLDSTLAYQIGGRGLPEDLVRYFNMVSSQGLRPDLTILLDVSCEVGLTRAKGKGGADRFEREALDFHRRVREYYLAIAKEDPARVKIVSTEKDDIETVRQKISKIVEGIKK